MIENEAMKISTNDNILCKRERCIHACMTSWYITVSFFCGQCTTSCLSKNHTLKSIFLN